MVIPREVAVIARMERWLGLARSVEVHRADAASRRPRRSEAAMVTLREVAVIRERTERCFDLARSVGVRRAGASRRSRHPGIRGAVRLRW